MTDKKPHIVLIGGGGHCISVIDVVEQQNKYAIRGILDPNRTATVLGYPILGGDDLIPTLVAHDVYFLITIGQIKSVALRIKLAQLLENQKANLATVISPHSYVSKHAHIEQGTVIMHHAVVNAGAHIGKHCIINSKCLIEHDANIGNHCHISTGAIVNADCKIGNNVFLGSNATVNRGIEIGDNVIVGSGSVVTRNIPANTIVMGIPAKTR